MTNGERLARIEQKLTDFIKAHEAIHGDVEIRLKKVEKIKNKIETPVKWVGWTVFLTVTGALAWFGEHAAQWLVRHFTGGN